MVINVLITWWLFVCMQCSACQGFFYHNHSQIVLSLSTTQHRSTSSPLSFMAQCQLGDSNSNSIHSVIQTNRGNQLCTTFHPGLRWLQLCLGNSAALRHRSTSCSVGPQNSSVALAERGRDIACALVE